MNPLLNELSTILANEVSLHEELVAAASRMNAALVKHCTPDVDRYNNRCDSLSCQIEALEEKRLEVSDRLAASLGCMRRHATIRQIIALLPSDQAALLTGIRERLRSLLAQLTRLNRSNRIFLESGLRLIEKTFEIIANNSRKTTGYHAQGTQARTSLETAVINRIA